GGGIRDRNVTGVQPCGLPITARARCGGTLERRRRRAHQPPGHYRGRPEYERGPDVRDDRKVAVSWHDPSLSSPANGPTCPSRRWPRSEEHTSELQSRFDLVCPLLLEK